MEDINKMNDTSNVVKLLQWYERDPHLLEIEKAAMHKLFPGFTLDKMDDDRLCWSGSLNIGVLGDNEWHIMAVYSPDYPNIECGERVRVYLMEPSRLINELEWHPKYLCQDNNGLKYISISLALGSAVSYLSLAIKWLIAFELVLNGDLSIEEFNSCNVI